MVSRDENELLTRIEGEAPMGRLMRENYWVPFSLSSHLVAGVRNALDAVLDEGTGWRELAEPMAG